MKTALILLSLICLTTITVAQEFSIFNYQEQGLYKLNKVKELKVYGYSDLDNGLLVAHVKFDTLGNILAARFFTSNNRQYSFDTLVYNGNHNLIKKTSYGDENKINYDTLIYDEHDSLVTRHMFYWDLSVATTNYKYYKWGKQVKFEQYKQDTLVSGSLVKYDSANRIFDQVYYGTAPALTRVDYLFDDAGRPSRYSFTYKTDDTTTTIFEYNKAGKMSSRFTYNKSDKSLQTFKYDSRGNMIESVFNSAGENSKTNHLQIFKYHTNNLLFQTRSFVNNKQYWKEKRVYIFY